MTPQELINDIDNCYGPCGKMCLSCPEAHYMVEIREVVVGLMQENKKLKDELQKHVSTKVSYF